MYQPYAQVRDARDKAWEESKNTPTTSAGNSWKSLRDSLLSLGLGKPKTESPSEQDLRQGEIDEGAEQTEQPEVELEQDEAEDSNR